MKVAYCVAVALSLAGTRLLLGQAPAASNAAAGQPADHGYTLQAHVREVITDVTVTDRQGNPVHGLPESAFHIFDNGNPQRLARFEEHTSSEAAATPIEQGPANVFNNDILLHPPAVFNVMVLDTAMISVVDQMYLRQELDRFINALPPTEPFAVFVRSSEHTTMVANFTSDHEKLLKAVDNVVPRLRQPGYQYLNEISLMQEICDYLQQYPGRKNVLWFTGQPNLLLRPDPESLSGQVDLRPVYDALEKARIALYPIDARGLMVSGPNSAFQHVMMEDQAKATGGQAIFNTNGLAEAARHIADTDASFYTLTYSPRDVKLDNKWHSVKVELYGGNYQLSYRHGYFDDGSNLKQAESAGRKRLLRNGDVAPALHLKPILFQVTVVPADPSEAAQRTVIRSSPRPPRRGERAYLLHYSVPLDVFPYDADGDQNQFTLGLGVLAFNQYGRAISRFADQVTLGVSKEHLDLDNASPNAKIGFDQLINLPDGEDFLYVAVWNMKNGRVGVVQIPLAVEKAKLHSLPR